MGIELREIRRDELAASVDAARAGGISLDGEAVARRRSVVACNKETPLGGALAHDGGGGRRELIVELRSGVKPALARDLIDQALRKAAASGITAVRVRLLDEAAATLLWKKADWLSGLKPVTPAVGSAR